MEPNQRQPLSWSEDTIIRDDKAGSLAIRINKAVASERTLFSIEIGRIDINQRFIRFLNPKIESDGGYQVAVSFLDTTSLDVLLVLANAHCRAVIENERLDKKRAREVADLDRDKPKMRPGLKKLGKQKVS